MEKEALGVSGICGITGVFEENTWNSRVAGGSEECPEADGTSSDIGLTFVDSFGHMSPSRCVVRSSEISIVSFKGSSPGDLEGGTRFLRAGVRLS